jgi:hypothetical protein
MAGIAFLTVDPTSIAWAEESAAPTESSIVQSTAKQADFTVVEEVWTLIKKYYIDKTYNGQVGFLRLFYQ